jgi:hypothetical protein
MESLEIDLAEPDTTTTSAEPVLHQSTGDDFDLDLDILEQVLKGMTPEAFSNGNQDEPHTDEDDFPSDINSEEPEHRRTGATLRPREEEDDFPSDLSSGDNEQLGEDDRMKETDQESKNDWVVKDTAVSRKRTRTTEQSFQFAARQVSAEQVGWESQSQGHTPRRSARTPLFLPDPDTDSTRSPSTTPRAHKRDVRDGGSIAPSPTRLGKQVIHGGMEEDDLNNMMPGSSVLGTPARTNGLSSRRDELAPSPIRRDQFTTADRQSAIPEESNRGEGAIDSYHADESEDGPPSNSPSPQRANDHGQELGVDVSAMIDRPIASSSPNPPVASTSRLPAGSQRFLVNPRNRRSTQNDFATASSSDGEDDHDMMPAPSPPPIRAPTAPRQLARRTAGPLPPLSQTIVKSSPRSPAQRRDAERDFIILPEFRRPAPLSPREPSIRRSPSARHSPTPARRPQSASRSASSHRPSSPRDTSSSRRSPSTAPSHDPRWAREQDYDSESPGRSPTRTPAGGIDYFMCDEDGSALESNPEYVVPPGHKPTRSVLHGKKQGQVSQYTRKTGRKRWTLEESLLLWRTAQKVPLEEPNPLAVVDYLHGEFGILSTELEDYNRQHMKDKMKQLIEVRCNNRRVVEGRARFWLPTLTEPDEFGNFVHPDKIKLQEEVEKAGRRKRRREAEAFKEKAAEEQRKKDAAKAKKKATKGKQAKKGKKRAAPHSSTEDEVESEEDGEKGEENNVVVTENPDEEDLPPEDDESYDPGKPTRLRRGRGRSSRGRATRASKKGDRAPLWVTEQDEELAADQAGDDAAIDNATEEDTSNINDTEQPLRRRRRAELFVEVPSSRPLTRSRSSKAAAHPTPKSAHEPDLKSRQPVSEEAPVADLSESEAETVYAIQKTGKMMRRSIGQISEPEPETLSMSATDDEEDYDTATSGEGGSQDDEVDRASPPRDDEETGPIEERLVDQPEQELAPESGDDETQRNEDLARRLEVQQKVLGGHDP